MFKLDSIESLDGYIKKQTGTIIAGAKPHLVLRITTDANMILDSAIERYEYVASGLIKYAKTLNRDRLTIEFSPSKKHRKPVTALNNALKKIDPIYSNASNEKDNTVHRDITPDERHMPEDDCNRNKNANSIRNNLRERIEVGKALIISEFVPSDEKDKIGTIILYNKAIAECKQTSISSYEAVLYSALAYQCSIAAQYAILKMCGLESEWLINEKIAPELYYERDVVTSSLARCYEYDVCMEQADLESNGTYRKQFRFDTLADNMIHLSMMLDIIHEPSSGIIVLNKASLIHSSSMAVELECRLLDESVHGWEKPGRVMIALYHLLKYSGWNNKFSVNAFGNKKLSFNENV